jgi:iron complex transport system substrate-binding protein
LPVAPLRKLLALCASFLMLSGAAPALARGPTLVSLDECADQYVLGLVERDRVLALSDHARYADSWFRDRAQGIRRVKPRLESVLALHPDMAVRTWGGDLRLIQELQRRGIRVVNIDDVQSFAAARAQLFKVGAALDAEAGAQIAAHRFDEALTDVRNIGHGRSVLYYTPTGTSAGADTLTGDMLTTLGFRLATTQKGYFSISPEALIAMKPDVFALGYYDDRYAMRRVPGRQPLVRALIEKTPHFALPDAAMACGGWFSIYALRDLSQETTP